MTSQKYFDIAAYLMSNTNVRPQVGIICGSGLSMLSDNIVNPEVFEYKDIPGFPHSTVQGHQGQLIFGNMDGIEVVCMKGRFHFYEGHSMQDVVLPVRVMRLMGVKLLVVTNAAGGLKPTSNVGDIVVIQDHFAMPILSGNNPLRGINDNVLGDRFPPVSDAYDPTLQSIIVSIAESLSLGHLVHQDGVYCYVSGPSYESKAECRFLRGLGGDTVGMSTVPEIIAARHCGMKLVCLSLVTNKVIIGNEDAPAASHAEVMEAVKNSGDNMERIVRTFVSKHYLGEFLHSSKSLPVFDYKAHLARPVQKELTSSACCKGNGCNEGCCKNGKCSSSGCCDTHMIVLHGVTLAAVAVAGYLMYTRK